MRSDNSILRGDVDRCVVEPLNQLFGVVDAGQYVDRIFEFAQIQDSNELALIEVEREKTVRSRGPGTNQIQKECLAVFMQI